MLKAVSTIGLLVFLIIFMSLSKLLKHLIHRRRPPKYFLLLWLHYLFIRLISIYYQIPYHHYLKPPQQLKALIAKDCYGKKFKNLSSEQKQEVGKTFAELKSAEIQKRGGFLKVISDYFPVKNSCCTIWFSIFCRCDHRRYGMP